MDGRFIKMHGLGNDFVVIDARHQSVPMDAARARAVADRHRGIGCDQLIMLEPSRTADVRMRIWNADGAEVDACGNATRCVASLLGERATIETAGGLLSTRSASGLVSVELPAPCFGWDGIPLAYAMDTLSMPVAWEDLADPVAVSVGNPHIIFFVDDASAIDLARLGPEIEHDSLFPERINVNVASVTGPNSLDLRVWERGAGLTLACGTGACATAVAALKRKLVSGPVTVSLPGGELLIDWKGEGPITMHGPATEVFRGTADWAAFG